MQQDELLAALEAQRKFYQSGATRTYAFRKEQLKKLKAAILQFEGALHEALASDLKKSAEECWVTETGFVISEISASLRGLRKWMQPERVGTNLLNLPSASYVLSEPLGQVLIIGPWNYPFQLLITPLVGAIAAGNCVTLKSSEFASATDAVMKQLIQSIFPPEYVLYVQGDGATVVPAMMNHFRFDHVFYTGSTAVGKLIYQMAASRLVPVTLELGGKSPCVVEADANLKVAARRIAVTKFSNAGQMCVAPDYLLVHESVKDKLVDAIKDALLKFYSEQPMGNYSYGKIINEKQFNRLLGYINQGHVLHGGQSDAEALTIAPTLLQNVDAEAPVMQEEIFGPILPVISFSNREEALAIISRHPNPLAFYIFTSSVKKEKEWLDAVAFGGGCVNNASWHLTNHYLPFGGRGNSGTGQYHGHHSFHTFSHRKAVMKTPTWFDPAIKYPPFKGKLWLFKRVIR